MAEKKFHRVGSPNEQILTSSQGLYISHALITDVAKSPNGKSFVFTPNRDGDAAKVEVIVTVRKANGKGKS